MKKIIAICFIVLVFILACIHASATDYYFSNAGNDGAAGTIGAPWQTISKFNSVFASLAPGDNIYFNRGDVFYGGLVISRSGSVGLPITIGAYGSGADPIITGFTTVTAWTNLGSNIWESTSAVSTLTTLNMVLIAGINRAMGRTPNTGFWTYTALSGTAVVGNTSTLSSTNLNSATTNWTNAEVVTRRFAWVIERADITGHSGNTITYFSTSGYAGRTGWGFFIQNDVRTLDAQNEWYYNPSTKKLRIYSTSNPGSVQVSTIDTLVKITSRNYITFDNISFTGSNKMTFQVMAAQNIITQNCLLDYNGGQAFWGGQNSSTSAGFIFRDNTINNTNNNGIVLRDNFTDAILQRNTIKNTGLQPGMVDKPYTTNSLGQAIRIQADGVLAEYNNIDSSGYNGISFYSNNVIMQYNFINNSLLTIADGGGIYSWEGGTPTGNMVGSKILYNIVLNTYGNNDGTIYTDLPQGQGIYLDDNVGGVEVAYNTAANGRNTGLFLHNNYNTNIHHNTFFNNGRATQWSSDNATYPIRTTTSKNNLFISRLSTQDIAWFRSGTGGLTELKNFGTPSTIDSNYYARPIDDNLTIKVKENQIFYPNRTLASWVAYSAFDAHSNKSPKAITNLNDLRFEYNATNASVVIPLETNYIDVRGVSYNSSITLEPYTSAVLIKNQNKYYFSNTGNDLAAGTEAAPFQTLTKLNSVFLTSAAGDSFLLKRGDTFNGFINIGRSGTSLAYMNIVPYGTGADPIITGFTTMAGWTNLGGGIWETPTTTALLPYLNMVTIDEVQHGIGRYPDTDATDGGYLKFESYVGTTSITDNQLTESPNDWQGATVVVRPFKWMFKNSLITNHVGGTLSFTGGVQPSSAGYGYFIQNDPRTLTRFGEWYYNPSTERLRMYFGGANPASHVVQAATVDSLLYSTGKSFVRISNITFKGANGSMINLKGSASNFYIDSCDLYFAGINGISYSTVNGTTFSGSYTSSRVTDCYIDDCNDNGILGNSTNGLIVRDNTVKDIYMIAGMGGERDGHGWSIRTGASGLVEYNDVINSGYNGIDVGNENSTIQYNFIDSFCIVKDDGGGIYTSNGNNVTYTNRSIKQNIILNGIGNWFGTPAVQPACQGIYMDNQTNGVTITDNTIAQGFIGMLFHDGRNMTARGNTFWNHSKGSVHALDDNTAGEITGLNIKSNLLITKDPTELTLMLSDNNDLNGTFGAFDSNYYAGLLGNNVSIVNKRNGEAIYEYHNRPSLNLRYGFEANGSYSLKNILPYKDVVLVGSNKITNVNNSAFTAAGETWTGPSVWSGTGGVMDAGHLVVTPSATVITETAMSIGSLIGGTPYIVRFSVKGSSYSNQGSFGVRIQSATTFAPYQYYKILATREEVEMLFVPAISGAGTLRVSVAEGGTPFYFDNFLASQATAAVTNIDDSVRFEYNDTKVAEIVSFPGVTYSDVRGTTYVDEITLQPFTSALLINIAEGTPNIAPTVSITSPANGAGYSAPATVVIDVIAGDADGTVTGVDFYQGATLIGSDLTAPYSFSWSPVAAGVYSLTAVATDNATATTTSTAKSISVVNITIPPPTQIKIRKRLKIL